VHRHLKAKTRPFFLVKTTGEMAEIGELEDFEEFFKDIPTESVRHLILYSISILPENS
jgi:hypothetical protein